ncbi:MAG: Fe-S cluster assembly protein IscX [Candidatus Omnitrophica bacterium]|nr:Fe-S cluster assembly protein IscX [Candidatus Omnitrophota bacterium]
MGLTWDDVDSIAERLMEKHGGIDPLSIRFTDLHKWVTELEDFDDDPKRSTEGILESIQMAWHELNQ